MKNYIEKIESVRKRLYTAHSNVERIWETGSLMPLESGGPGVIFRRIHILLKGEHECHTFSGSGRDGGLIEASAFLRVNENNMIEYREQPTYTLKSLHKRAKVWETGGFAAIPTNDLPERNIYISVEGDDQFRGFTDNGDDTAITAANDFLNTIPEE